MAGDELLLSMDGISKAFNGVPALRQASFDVRRGEVHALIGQNGAGKSTLIKILTGVYDRAGGEIVYDGKLQNGWEDWGWSTRDFKSGPASVDFGKWGGWILAKPKIAGRYGGLVFRMKPPEGEAELLEV